MNGARVGDYVIERQLGTGGMGSVFLGRSRSGRAVAIKVVKTEYAADPRFRQRFRKEVEAARKVGGFHTAAVVDADPDAPQPWMASAYIKGPTLADEVARNGPLDEDRLWSLAASLAEALEAIHSCGLVHRDLKPGNIILAEDGPRVLDFGIARALEGTQLTHDGSVIGSSGFIAPEQVQGLDITGACDVFSLGAVLIAAAGGSAFGNGTPYGLMYRAVHTEADVSAVPDDLRPLVLACLSKDPGERPTPGRLLDMCGDRLSVTAGHAGGTPVGLLDDAHPRAVAVAVPASAPASVASSPVDPRQRQADDRSTIVPWPPLAHYRRPRRTRSLMILRNAVLTGVLLVLAAVSSGGLSALAVLAALIASLRLAGLLRGSGDGISFNELGIRVDSLRKQVVLPWADIRSVELNTSSRESRLTVWTGGPRKHRLPPAVQPLLWVRGRFDGTVLIRTRWLTPQGAAPPLPQAVRTFAAHHAIPVSETRSS
ncbi:serine/threonine-protein kinase [Streptomyces sp. NPDC033538]|uniref:serine/threonine-protein kinase n=1 Tax=Streptomyces sp. NPDC033538 TaxID=3155367 RepID=UPI0033CF6204